MIKKYSFDYDGKATASFTVDTDMFTPEIAKETLTFFVWDYDKEADPVDEVLKKYALRAMYIATCNNYNLQGVTDEFEDQEGFCHVDGRIGIELTEVTGYPFDDDDLLNVECEIQK
jgi:hypothetical protein